MIWFVLTLVTVAVILMKMSLHYHTKRMDALSRRLDVVSERVDLRRLP